MLQMPHVHSYYLKEEKYSGDYAKHFSTSASVGTMQKNHEVTINVYRELESKERFKTLVLHFVCASGEYENTLLYLTSNCSQSILQLFLIIFLCDSFWMCSTSYFMIN